MQNVWGEGGEDESKTLQNLAGHIGLQILSFCMKEGV